MSHSHVLKQNLTWMKLNRCFSLGFSFTITCFVFEVMMYFDCTWKMNAIWINIPREVSVLTAWSSTWVAVGVGPSAMSWSQGLCLWRTLLFTPSCFPFPGRCEMSSFLCMCLLWLAAFLGPKPQMQTGPTSHGWHPYSVSQCRTFLCFSWLSQVFYTMQS